MIVPLQPPVIAPHRASGPPVLPGPWLRRSLRFGWAQLKPWILPFVVLAGWEGCADLGWLPTRILPAPSHVIGVGWRLTRSGELPMHIWASTERAAVAMAIGALLGIGLGLASGLFRWVEDYLDSSIQMLRTIPSLALIPMAILWFGIGEECKLFLMVVGAFFPLYITTYLGIRSIDQRLIEVARIYGLSRGELIRHVLLPAALPSVLVGLRMSFGLMWINLIVVETIATDRGIGYLVNNAREFMQTDIIVLGILLYALLRKLADSSVRLIERRVVTWKSQFQGL